MYCKNKKVSVSGLRYDGNENQMVKSHIFNCIITNDERGRKLSIDDGCVQYTIPFDEIAKYLKVGA